ncbi:MAG: hypothetical protein V3W34_01065 [Phycisphaerae bacterium]
MAKLRIVADTSVMKAAYVRETLPYQGNPFDITRRATPILDAIRLKSVLAFAPETLPYEFFKSLYREAHPREVAPTIEVDVADLHALDFMRLRITYTPSDLIAASAWNLMREADIPPPDSWFVACAMYHDAELWFTHRQSDRVVENAQKQHRKTFVLTEKHFVTDSP